MKVHVQDGEALKVEVSGLEVTVGGQGVDGIFPPRYIKTEGTPPFVTINPEESGSIATLLYVAKPEITQEIRNAVGATNPQAFYVL